VLIEAFHHIGHRPVGPDPAYPDDVENLALGMVFLSATSRSDFVPES